jgi:hypothetical protein
MHKNLTLVENQAMSAFVCEQLAHVPTTIMMGYVEKELT